MTSLDLSELENLRSEQVSVTRREVFHNIREKIQEEKVLIALPLCFFLFVTFLGLCIFFERNTDRQAIVSGITDDIMENCNFEFDGPLMLMGFKGMDDVHSIRDIWEWMDLGFWPQVMWQSETLGQYLLYNQIIGGARILTQTYEEDEAKCNSKIVENLNMKCMKQPEQDFLAIGMDDLALKPRGIETSSWSTGPTFSGRATLARWWLMYRNGTDNESLTSHRQTLRAMRAANTINRNVKQVQISVVMYNADVNLVSLTEANFFLSRTGMIWPVLRIQTLDPNVFRNHWPNLVFLLIWCILLCLNILNDVVTLIRLIHQVGLKWLRMHLPHGPLWYSLDVVGFACGLMYLITLLSYYRQTQKINQALLSNITALTTNATSMETLLSDIEIAEHKLHWIYRAVLIIYPINLLFRLGLAFAMQPRLSVTPRIVIVAFTDLYHFLIVLSSFVLCFACFALVMFGRYLEDYSSFPRAVIATVRMLFGDIDWEAMQVVGFVRACVFYVLFQFTVGLVLFNVLLAIILDSYEEVRSAMGASSPTVLEQAVAFILNKKKIWKKEKTSLQVIWLKAWQAYGASMLDDSPITADELQGVVEGLQEAQAHELINEVVASHQYMSVSTPEVYDGIMRVDGNLQKTLVSASAFQRTISRARAEIDDETPSMVWPPQKLILPANVENSSGCFKANKLNLTEVAGVLALAKSLAKDESPLLQKAIDLALQSALSNANQVTRPSKTQMLADDEDGQENGTTVGSEIIRSFSCNACAGNKPSSET